MRQLLFTIVICFNSILALAAPFQATQPTDAQDLNPNVLKLALNAYECARLSGVTQQDTLTIIDYSKPSTEKRLWVIDLASKKTLYHSLVAHGKGSGNLQATRFSNKPDTHASSIGLYLTGTVYKGRHGISLRLNGLDEGFNDQAAARAIVVHGAPYVNDAIAEKNGRLGLSWGCPAVPKQLAAPLINTIKNGTLVFAYYPDHQWLKKSKYMNCPAAALKSSQYVYASLTSALGLRS